MHNLCSWFLAVLLLCPFAVYAQDLHQLHDDGSIWRYTGTPCSGDSCPGWDKLDNNPLTVAIAAADNQLYQLHSTGWIWRYTGTPCSGDFCPGWDKLDNNPLTVAIVAADNQLYQLHSTGWIWRYAGTPCSGDSCPGWDKLDNNPLTVAIVAADHQLYQLHNTSAIWRYTGTPCNGDSCPGWEKLDDNRQTKAMTTAQGLLYQLHSTGWIWHYTGTPCSGSSCPGWERLDDNSRTVAIVAVASQLYQLHNTGWIWRYTGIPCSGDFCPGWERLDNNPQTVALARNTASINSMQRLQVSRFLTTSLTAARADRILASASNVLRARNGTGDVACNAAYARIGEVTTFATGDGSIDTQAEFDEVVQLGGYVKVVNAINWCGALRPNIIGCAPRPGTSLVVVRYTLTQEGILWAHEYGHTKGLRHRSTETAVMNGTIGATHKRINATECMAFRH